MSYIPVKLITLGCPKNYVDSEIIKNIFNSTKYKVVDDSENADIIIVNTCGFITDAKKESIEMILNAVKFKNEKKIKKLMVTGCLSQRYREELLKEIPEIDYIFGVDEFPAIYKTFHDKSIKKPFIKRKLITPSHYAYLKISEGCDNYCSYCAIPFIRGKLRSRRLKSLVEEAKFLAQNGVRELILVAEDTTSYGIDIYGKRRLPALLEKLAQIEQLKWIRILYAYPSFINDDLLKIISENEKICKYIDIPVQHASDKILKSMKRNYTQHSLYKLIENIRNIIPEIGLRTSVITGFPGESKKDFEALVTFVESVRFERLGVFTYSREEGTPAYNIKNQISQKEKEERADEIKWIQKEISYNKNQNQIGKEIEVIVDIVDEKKKSSIGRTGWDAPEIDNIVSISKEIFPGTFYKTTITNATEFELEGF